MIHIDKSKRWIFLRIGAIICLILAMFNLELKGRSKKTTTIFLVDRSLSVIEEKDEIKSYINSQIQNKESKDTFGIISFGKNSMIEVPLSNDIQDIDFNTNIDQNFTDIAEGIHMALNLFPRDSNKRLVIFTDGIENMGSYRDTIERIEEENVNVYIYPLHSKETRDVELKSINIPSNIHEDIPVNVELFSNFETKGTLYLYADDKKLMEEEIHIEEGLNILRYSLSSGKGKYKKIRGEINVSEDTNPHNNMFTTEIQEIHEPKVLVIGEEKDKRNVQNILSSIDLNIKSYRAKEVPSSLDFLMDFNEIILVNVPHDSLSSELEENIEYCIKSQGTGLLVVGGENTFSLGGYKDTVLEKMLPVDSHISGDEKKPNTGIVLAIDSSGSMEDESGGAKKIDMAKEAAKSSIEVLNEEDYIGVLAFSDTLEWIVPYGKVEDKLNIESNIGKLKAKGGTLILPGLEEAVDTFSNSNTKINHIILLTDGEGEKEGYEELLNTIKEKDITLSTIAIGSDSDVNFLKLLSQQSGGRNYFVEDVDNIPEIFAKETYIATRKYINEREFVPKLEGSNLFTDSNFPKLKGYTSTSLKKEGMSILKTDLDEPLLAERQYGLGKVMVWTSDLNGKWSGDWVNWREFQNFWEIAINYILGENHGIDENIETVRRGNIVDIFVYTCGDVEKIDMTLLDREKNQEKYNMKQVEKGKFSETISLSKIGGYIAKFQIQKKDGSITNYSRIIYLDYSPEYSLKEIDSSERIDFLNTWRAIDEETEVFKLPIVYKNSSNIELGNIFLLLALLMFIADLWMRKRDRRLRK